MTAKPFKILIVGPSWVGDMMMAQVLFQLLRQQNPTAIIHVLAPKWSHALLARMPEINHAIELPFGHGAFQLKKRFEFAKTLRVEQYDQAIVIPNSWKSALIPFFAKIPKRTGWCGEYRFGLLNDVRYLNKKELPLMVQRMAALAYSNSALMPANLPTPKLTTCITHEKNRTALLQKYSLTADKPILALCPGAEFGPSKIWPSYHYATVANQKIKEGFSVWIFGSPNDCAIANDIQNHTDNHCENLVGKTTLSDAVDLLSLAHCVVTNDSGLMHVAAALNRDVVAIYGSTSPDFTPPLSDKAKILKLNLDCQPCFQRHCPLKHHHCMTQLLPEQVLKANGSSGSSLSAKRIHESNE